MATLTAEGLRTLARDVILQTGTRGFVRFLPKGDPALLVTDALMHVCGDAEKLCPALEAAGFDVRVRGSLLVLTPCDRLLAQMAEVDAPPAGIWDWDDLTAPAFALAYRWLRMPDAALSSLGRQLALETARLLSQPHKQVLCGLRDLRARAAVMQRSGEQAGLHLCGGMLWNWCLKQTPCCDGHKKQNFEGGFFS